MEPSSTTSPASSVELLSLPTAGTSAACDDPMLSTLVGHFAQ
jgi:hypothetical protein